MDLWLFRNPCLLSFGVGTWPAIWILGRGDMPPAGETDRMEQIGAKPEEILGTPHMAKAFGGHGIIGLTHIPHACDCFHLYQLLGTPDEMVFGVDSRAYDRYTNPHTDQDRWPFDGPQYMILNLALGGDLGGQIKDSDLPRRFEIDYMRVYQRTSMP